MIQITKTIRLGSSGKGLFTLLPTLDFDFEQTLSGYYMLVRFLFIIILVVMFISLKGLRSVNSLMTLHKKYTSKTCMYDKRNFGTIGSIPNLTTNTSFRGFGAVPTKSSSINISKQKKLQDLIKAYQSVNPAAQVKSNMITGSVSHTVDISTCTSTPAGSSDVSVNQTSKKIFADTMTFPTEFLIKIVGMNDPSFASDIVKLVSSHVGEQSLQYSTKETAGGKYISVSIKPLFNSSEELYSGCVHELHKHIK